MTVSRRLGNKVVVNTVNGIGYIGWLCISDTTQVEVFRCSSVVEYLPSTVIVTNTHRHTHTEEIICQRL